MPVRRIDAAEAYESLKTNPDALWPRRDDPTNRFAHFADPHFSPRFVLEPGQRIFTIGSCFARGVERALAERGFDIPTLEFRIDRKEWGGEPTAVLNNYVPPAIAPQIRWAFGMERFELDRHAVQVGRDRYVDLQLPFGFRPGPAEALLRRREDIGAVYRRLADSNVVVITLGLIEAWFDNRSGLYCNSPPPKSATRDDPRRFELHVLDYNDVTASLEDLMALLESVCPSGFRTILTVSPVPMTATFTSTDVAVANAYSKAVLRAAVEPFVAGRERVEYFPSFESVVLTDRSIAFVDDQVHVSGAMIRFNVDRMVNRYVREAEAGSTEDEIDFARKAQKRGLFRVGFGRLQRAYEARPDDPKLAVALADAQIRGGAGPAAEALLLKLLDEREDVAARTLLARYYNDSGRHEEAALQAEKASELGKMRLHASLQRIVAYYHLGRYEEGLAVLAGTTYAVERKMLVENWKGRFCDKLGRDAQAEEHFRVSTGMSDDPAFHLAFAEFLAARGRWPEAAEEVDKVLLASPQDPAALRLRAELRKRGLDARAADMGPRLRQTAGRAAWWSASTARRLLRSLPLPRARS